jgi:hypothetical protein
MAHAAIPITSLPGADTALVEEVTLNTVTWVEAGFLDVLGRKGLMGVEIIAPAGLTDLRITRSVWPGAHADDEQVDAIEASAFDTVDSFLQQVKPATGADTATGTIQLVIQVDGYAEIGFEAKGNAGDITIRANLPAM